MSPPACTLVRCLAALCLDPQVPSSGAGVTVEDGPRRTEPQPPPPAPRCRGTVPELSQHADGTVTKGGLVLNQKGVRRGDRIRQKENVLVLTEQKLQILPFAKPEVPLPP